MGEEDAAKDQAGVRLAGKRILITRAAHQASHLASRLRELGAEVVAIPTIEIAPPTSFASLDAAIAALQSFDWIVFTSANAVRVFGERVARPLAAANKARIAVVGPATARAAEAIGLGVDRIPVQFTAESLRNALTTEVRDRNVLLVVAEDAPAALAESLREGGARVTVAAAYANRIPDTSLAKIGALLATDGEPPDAVTFTSASTARNLAALLQRADRLLPASVARISIGPVTSQALRDLGIPPHAEAAEATIAALVDAVVRRFDSNHGRQGRLDAKTRAE